MRSICIMREIYKSLGQYEADFETAHGVTLNEAMSLIALYDCCDKLSSGDLSKRIEMRNSHTSKIIKSIESKKLIERTLGEKDKRQMYFTLTDKGRNCIDSIMNSSVDIPEILSPIFKN